MYDKGGILSPGELRSSGVTKPGRYRWIRRRLSHLPSLGLYVLSWGSLGFYLAGTRLRRALKVSDTWHRSFGFERFDCTRVH